VRLRYYMEYQDGLGEGTWTANAFHPYSFLGIALSPYRTLECRRFLQAQMRSRGFWQPVRDEIQFDVIQGTDGRLRGAIWNGTGLIQTIRLSLDKQALALGGPGSADARAAWLLTPGLATQMVLQPGLTLVAAVAPQRKSPSFEVAMPAAVRVLSGRSAGVAIELSNGTRKAVVCSLEPHGVGLSGFGKDASASGSAARMVTVRPMSAMKLAARVTASEACVAPYDVGVTVRANGRQFRRHTQVLVLPSTVALMDLESGPFVRGAQLGAARVFVTNRLERPSVLSLKWSLGSLANGAEKLRLAPHASKEWRVPLRYATSEPIRSTLRCDLDVPHFGHIERSRRIRILPAAGVLKAPQSFVLYDFEAGDTDGWFMPAWAEGNQDDSGSPRRPYIVSGPSPSGGGALESPIRITGARFSAAFFGVRVEADWRASDSLSVDVYLPPDAPKGLEARYYLIGSDWKWREPPVAASLKPGSWKTLSIPLSGLEGTLTWKLPGKALSDVMAWVQEFGVKICNAEPGLVGYRGIVRLGDVRIMTR